MGIAVERADEGVHVSIEGAASVRIVSEARSTLLELLDGGVPVRVDLSAVRSADVAFVQLLISARRSFAGKGSSLHVDDPEQILSAAVPGAVEHANH